MPNLAIYQTQTIAVNVASKMKAKSSRMAQTNLVNENCYLSKELKVQIALELAKNITRK